MSKIYCVICNKKVESVASKYRKWHVGGEVVEGWGCEKHWNHMAQNIELVPAYNQEERLRFAPDTIQSHRQGDLSKEWVERYPDRTKGMVEAGMVTQEDVDKAKDVWKQDMKGLE